jgi:hypothetical protein
LSCVKVTYLGKFANYHEYLVKNLKQRISIATTMTMAEQSLEEQVRISQAQLYAAKARIFGLEVEVGQGLLAYSGTEMVQAFYSLLMKISLQVSSSDSPTS